MPITDEHYQLVRNHFIVLLGSRCSLCGSVFNLEIHHMNDKHDMQGEGRGRTNRMWNWFSSYEINCISLLCRDCHKKYHNGNGDNDE